MKPELPPTYGKPWNPNTYYKNSDIADGYDEKRFTSLAGKLFNYLEKRSIRKAFEGLPKDSLILDAPCGTGRLAEVLLEEGYQVFGLDVSEEMLTVARNRLARFGERFQSAVGDIRTLESNDQMFDAAMCMRFLMHFPQSEQREFLSVIASRTKHKIVFNQSVNTPYHRMRRSLKRILGHKTPVSFPLTPSEAKSLVQESKLKLTDTDLTAPVVSEAMVFICEKPAV